MPPCTNVNHDYFIRIGVACDCAITTMVVNGKRVDATVKEVREARQ